MVHRSAWAGSGCVWLLRAILCVLVAGTPVTAVADASSALAARQRLAALAKAEAPALDLTLYTQDRMPRVAFRRGEEIVLRVRSETPGRLFGLLVDSHDVVTLLGSEPAEPGWLGRVEPGRETSVAAVPTPLWKTGLPAGTGDLYVFVVSDERVSDLTAIARESDSGVVPEKTLPALVEQISRALNSRSPRAHERLPIHISSTGRTRGPDGDVPTPTVVTSEEIIDYFTGPRVRAVERTPLDVHIQFAYDESRIDDGTWLQVSEIGAALRSAQLGSLRFVLAGHADRRGTREYNLELSASRAAAVRKALQDEFGIEPSRLRTEGHGSDQLLDEGNTEEAHAVNRRVELRLVRD